LLGFDTSQASDQRRKRYDQPGAECLIQTFNQPDPVITAVFPTTGIGNQLKQVAKLIKIKDTLGMKRQIFFCSIGGFDTHTNETSADPTIPNGSGAQGNLLTQFSQACPRLL
jgi:uncharacterized protein (DUF1501 family)